MAPKVWLITGTSSGLGRAVTEAVLAQGDIVVATARKPSALDNLTQQYSSDRLLILKLDVLKTEDIKSAFASAIETFGRLDVVYSNSGLGVLGEIEGVSEESGRYVFDVNVWGAANVALEAVRVFRDVNKPIGGRLIVASSIGAVVALPGLGHYSASKFAIDGLCEGISKEISPEWNIKITLLQFGSFVTNNFDNCAVSDTHPAYTDLPVTQAVQAMQNAEITTKTGKPASVAAKVVCEVAVDESAPLRVPVGLDAFDVLKARGDECAESIQYGQKWRSLYES